LILPENSQSLWRGVKILCDVNTTTLPNQYLNNETINAKDLTDECASFFDTKIRKVINNAEIDENVYNGRKVINATNRMFMDTDYIRSCVRADT
jgi:hypothetical protein